MGLFTAGHKHPPPSIRDKILKLKIFDSRLFAYQNALLNYPNASNDTKRKWYRAAYGERKPK